MLGLANPFQGNAKEVDFDAIGDFLNKNSKLIR